MTNIKYNTTGKKQARQYNVNTFLEGAKKATKPIYYITLTSGEKESINAELLMGFRLGIPINRIIIVEQCKNEYDKILLHLGRLRPSIKVVRQELFAYLTELFNDPEIQQYDFIINADLCCWPINDGHNNSNYVNLFNKHSNILSLSITNSLSRKDKTEIYRDLESSLPVLDNITYDYFYYVGDGRYQMCLITIKRKPSMYSEALTLGSETITITVDDKLQMDRIKSNYPFIEYQNNKPILRVRAKSGKNIAINSVLGYPKGSKRRKGHEDPFDFRSELYVMSTAPVGPAKTVSKKPNFKTLGKGDIIQPSVELRDLFKEQMFEIALADPIQRERIKQLFFADLALI